MPPKSETLPANTPLMPDRNLGRKVRILYTERGGVTHAAYEDLASHEKGDATGQTREEAKGKILKLLRTRYVLGS